MIALKGDNMFLFAITHGRWHWSAIILLIVSAISFWLLYLLVETIEKPLLRFLRRLFPISEETIAIIILVIMAVISFVIGTIATFYVVRIVN